jgi:hypothetical protein
LPEHEPALHSPSSPPATDYFGEKKLPHDPLFDDPDEKGPLPHNSDDEERPQSPLPENLPPAANEPIVLGEVIKSLKFVWMVEDAALESHPSPEALDTPQNPRAHLSPPSDAPDLRS